MAGRLKLDGTTIDSPLQNIALYDYIMKNPGANVLPEDYDDLDTAASLFGAAADKTTPITIDTLVYSNTILGLTPMMRVRLSITTYTGRTTAARRNSATTTAVPK